MPDASLIRTALQCKCPRCGEGDLYQPGFSLSLRDRCANCQLDLAKNDSADGPAVFLIFILGFTMVPLALLLEYTLHPPLWAHGMIWGVILLGVTLGTLKPLKAYVIALQYKHRPNDWL